MRVLAPRRRGRYRRCWASADFVCWILAVYAATLLRLDFDIGDAVRWETAACALAMALLHLALGLNLGPYAVGHSRGSFEEIVDIGLTVALTTIVGFSVVLLLPIYVLPRTVPLTAGPLAAILMLMARMTVRSLYARRRMRDRAHRRAIVFGAGEGGRQLVRTMIRTPDAGIAPVAVLDDDVDKHRLHVEQVRVHGGRDDLRRTAARTGADTLAVAVPSADAALLRDLRRRADEAGLQMLVLPPMSEFLDRRPSPQDLRDVDVSDLLGRRPVTLDDRVISDQLAGSTVVVTGAGGSIGSELCRQISMFAPRKLYLLDRDESGLQATMLSLSGSGLLDSDDIVLADIRDLATLRRTFRDARPHMVFHAAALKHLPLLENHPLEAWKSNVLGTLNVLTAAAESDVEVFVNISTDKAANPTCVLGYSKRIAERLTAGFAGEHGGRYVSVRFGNVLGSRGSVVHAFTAQIQRGGPVTVTHPEVERYFMLIPEACQLVLQAASVGHDGQVLVLDMGKQVSIREVAQTLIHMSGRDVDVVFTGLRPGEKLREELFSCDEQPLPTTHELVSAVDVPALAHRSVMSTGFTDHESARAWLRAESDVGRLHPSTIAVSTS